MKCIGTTEQCMQEIAVVGYLFGFSLLDFGFSLELKSSGGWLHLEVPSVGERWN